MYSVVFQNGSTPKNESKTRHSQELNVTMASGSSSSPQDCRIVLLGKAGVEKRRIVKTLLPDEKLEEEREKCVVHEGEHSGRRIRIVNTPGWDRVSREFMSDDIKNEILISMSLSHPGPHAVILVLPVNPGDQPSVNELKTAMEHTELLSERVWNHTMVLFLCDEDVDQSTVRDHIENAKTLLEKCRGRYYPMRSSEDSESHIDELLNHVDQIVQENCGEYFMPKLYDMSKKKEERELKTCPETVPRKRHNSLQELPPIMSEGLTETSVQAARMRNSPNEMQRPVQPKLWIMMLLIFLAVGAMMLSVYMNPVIVIVISGVTIITVCAWTLLRIHFVLHFDRVLNRANRGL